MAETGEVGVGLTIDGDVGNGGDRPGLEAEAGSVVLALAVAAVVDDAAAADAKEGNSLTEMLWLLKFKSLIENEQLFLSTCI